MARFDTGTRYQVGSTVSRPNVLGPTGQTMFSTHMAAVGPTKETHNMTLVGHRAYYCRRVVGPIIPGRATVGPTGYG